jgi:hypothetical protein
MDYYDTYDLPEYGGGFAEADVPPVWDPAAGDGGEYTDVTGWSDLAPAEPPILYDPGADDDMMIS